MAPWASEIRGSTGSPTRTASAAEEPCCSKSSAGVSPRLFRSSRQAASASGQTWKRTSMRLLLPIIAAQCRGASPKIPEQSSLRSGTPSSRAQARSSAVVCVLPERTADERRDRPQCSRDFSRTDWNGTVSTAASRAAIAISVQPRLAARRITAGLKSPSSEIAEWFKIACSPSRALQACALLSGTGGSKRLSSSSATTSLSVTTTVAEFEVMPSCGTRS
mmetsp:Transcript_6787/g.16379  ORF Transcript_6787/g.16379 Transcript_6787/m.16379 type:complete len:220 (-) Transcript_6787:787-1446(-)